MCHLLCILTLWLIHTLANTLQSIYYIAFQRTSTSRRLRAKMQQLIWGNRIGKRRKGTVNLHAAHSANFLTLFWFTLSWIACASSKNVKMQGKARRPSNFNNRSNCRRTKLSFSPSSWQWIVVVECRTLVHSITPSPCHTWLINRVVLDIEKRQSLLSKFWMFYIFF